ncbi:hypothetical protein R3P38DRAFT_3240527 [Favolaschia claudopus]|uniref:F-box domain-containing protein n=1 Tax=Favolaschia claudopus TaxID=2862362 RepID=A0AAV9Z710_9AGAR
MSSDIEWDDHVSDTDSEKDIRYTVASHPLGWGSTMSLAYLKFTEIYRLPPTACIKFRSFPDEILAAILVLVFERFDDRPDRWRSTRIRLAFICKRWMRVITGMICFHSAFCIQPSTRLHHIYDFEKRTGSIEVSLAFSFRGTGPQYVRGFEEWLHECIGALGQAFSRCAFLFMKVEDVALSRLLLAHLSSVNAMALRGAVVQSAAYRWIPEDTMLDDEPVIPPLFGGQMPVINTLTVAENITRWTTPYTSSSLTSLTLERLYNLSSLSVAQLFLVLRHTPLLRYLRFNWVSFYDYRDDNVALDPPTMQSLTHLSLVVETPSSLRAIVMLHMPALVNLQYEATTDDAVIGILEHFGYVGQTIDRLSVRIGLPTVEVLLDILHLFPNITRLDTRGCAHGLYLVFHALTVHWPDALPRLQEVVFDEYVPEKLLRHIAKGPDGASPSRLSVIWPGDLDHRLQFNVPMASSFAENGDFVHSSYSTEMARFSR